MPSAVRDTAIEMLELRDFVENVVVPMHWVGPDGHILWANRAELDLLGYTLDEYIGTHIADVHVDRPVIDDILGRLTRNETLREYPARLRRKNGSVIEALISSSVYRRSGEFVHTRCATIDVTARRRAERLLEAQHAVSHALAESPTLAVVAPRILRAIGDAGSWSLGALWLVDQAEDVLRCVDAWRASHLDGAAADAFETVTRHSRFVRGVGLPGRVWQSGEPTYIRDLGPDSDFPRLPHAARAGLRTAFAFPVRLGGRVTGVVEFFSEDERESAAEHLQLFEGVGAQIGLFIHKRHTAELQARLAAVVDSSDDAIVTKTLDGIITTWNRGAERIFGYTADEAIGRSIALIIPPERLAEEDDVLSRLRRGEKIDHFETERVTKDGRRLTISLSVSPLRDADGAITGASKVARDVTDRRRAEAAAAESERRFRLIADSAPVPIWVNNAVGGCEFVNRAYLDFFGATLAEVQGSGWHGGVHPDDRDRYVAEYAEARSRRSPFRSEVRLRRADGEYRWTESYALPRFSGAGEFVGYVGVSPDITDRKRAEQTLRASEELAREQAHISELLSRVGNEVASSLDRSNIVQRVTDAATQLAGAEFGAFFYNVLDDASGEALLLYTLSGAPKEAFADFPKPRATAVFGPTFRGEGTIRLDDVTRDPRYGQNAPNHGMPAGHLPVRSYLAVPVTARSGEALGGLFFGHSSPGVFTAHHQQLVEGVATWASVALENARLYAEAERAVAGRDDFLSIVAHELRNPLNALQLQLVGLHRAAEEGPDSLPRGWVSTRLKQATDDAARIVRLVHNLLDVSRITAGRIDVEPEDLEFGAVIATVVARFAPQLKPDQLSVDVPPISGRWDRLRLDQIVTNLLSNAIKYGNGTRIEIAARTDGGRVHLTVGDHGIGIDVDQHGRLFTRFERLAPRKQAGGFGLGLWITRQIVEAMGGTITVDSQKGRGATFSVTLPLNAHTRPVPSGPDRLARPSREVVS